MTEPAALQSRPVRLAATLTGNEEAALDHLFLNARVLVRLEEAFAEVEDARETLLSVVNQVTRFCPNIVVDVGSSTLVAGANAVVAQVHGAERSVEEVRDTGAVAFDVMINIGQAVLSDPRATTVNSTGWVARVANAGSGVQSLPWRPAPANPVGAMAASCLGAGAAFLYLLKAPPATRATEFSLFTLLSGQLGTLPIGPDLPDELAQLDAFLIGCGGVSSGWAYTVRRLPIGGSLQAIDRQSLRVENLGPYVGAQRQWRGKPKAEIIAEILAPKIKVTGRADEWELFKIRLKDELAVPPLIVNGLDHVGTRHSAQRLWPHTLIDMAAGGVTSQVILKRTPGRGICLLKALHRPDDELDWADRAARDTGLRRERILEGPTTRITQNDVDQAPAEPARALLQRDVADGRLVCGRVTDQSMKMEEHNPGFAPAAPFVTGFSGVVGAAATMKLLLGYREPAGFYFQFSFQSCRSRMIEMVCDPGCECQSASTRASVYAYLR